MVVRIDVQPELFEWARERSGIEDDVWGSRFPKYDDWLAGEVRPTLKQLQSFAKKTYTPVGFFFLEEPPNEGVPIRDFRTIRDTDVGDRTVSANLLDTIYVCQARQEWFRDHQLMNGDAPLEFVGSAGVDTSTAEVAGSLREHLGWTADHIESLRSWADALTSLRERAESIGVLVMISGVVASNNHRKLDPDVFRGFALADPYAPVVFVNGADSKAAQIFTLAHELAHIWLGETGLDDLDPRSERQFEIEQWCNQVAAELLIPIDRFRELFDPDEPIMEQLDPLAEAFRVSTLASLGRVREAGRLSWEAFMGLFREEQVRIAGVVAEGGTGGNSYYTKPVQVGKRFARELISSTLEGRTPYTEAFRLLNVKRTSTFENLAERLGVG